MSAAKPDSSSRTQSIARVGIAIALISVSAWITVPFGPIPFTMQTFAILLMALVLQPKEAVLAFTGYLALGIVGVPVFAGMRGGIGVLLGPTGGFLWGWWLGVALAEAFLHTVRKCFGRKGASAVDRSNFTRGQGLPLRRRAVLFIRGFGVDLIAGTIFSLVSYACGCIHYMAIGHIDLVAALVVSVVPFLLTDICKMVVAIICADAVRAALNSTRDL